MSNPFFKFKQFTVYQYGCSMKVGTDSCIFGAYVASYLQTLQFPVKSVLDIGTGTGVLSLMVAQKIPATIDAIEIDEAAAAQAKQNFNSSPWKERLHVLHLDAKQLPVNNKYDCIISNPPFYEADLHSPDKKKNAAKHETTLNFEQLLETVHLHLADNGIFFVLLPYHRLDHFVHTAAVKQFFLREKFCIQHSPSHPLSRGTLVFTRLHASPELKQWAIKDTNGNYSREFTGLLKDYYLYL